jgi:hypothetical protein
MEKLFSFILPGILVIFANIYVRMTARKGRVAMNEDGFFYENQYMKAKICFSDVNNASLERNLFGRGIVMQGQFTVAVTGFGHQSRKIMVIHESKNFDLCDIFEAIRRGMKNDA